jgi:hypothetical protein
MYLPSPLLSYSLWPYLGGEAEWPSCRRSQETPELQGSSNLRFDPTRLHAASVELQQPLSSLKTETNLKNYSVNFKATFTVTPSYKYSCSTVCRKVYAAKKCMPWMTNQTFLRVENSVLKSAANVCLIEVSLSSYNVFLRWTGTCVGLESESTPPTRLSHITLIKKKIKFSSFIRKFRWERLQSHI